MDVKDENGKVVNWRLETGSPSSLMLRGWTRETMKTGDHVVVHVPNVAAARSVTMANGQTIFGGQMDDGGPTR
jgi:hypothetical protein